MNEGIVIDVAVEGIADLQFDRYTGRSADDTTLEDQLYIDDAGGLVLPAANLLAFFYSANYPSALTMFWSDIKTRKIVGQTVKASVFVDPQEIPILRKDKQIMLGGFKKNKYGKFVDAKAGMYVDESLPRVKGAVVPNPNKKRPTLRMPWGLKFQVRVFEIEGSEVNVGLVESWLRRGGMMIGVGTHRPMFGRFKVTEFAPRQE